MVRNMKPFFLLILLLGLFYFGQPVSFVMAQSRYSNKNNIINETFDTRFGVSGFEKYSNIDFSHRDPNDANAECYNGKFIGPNDETSTFDCQSLCDDRTGKQFEYQFFAKTLTLFGRKFKGGYCLPKLINSCNESVATPIWQNGYIACIPRYPNIINENNKILGCKGKLRDNLTGIVHTNFLPPEIKFTHIDVRLSNGNFRFECDPTATDSMGNSFVNVTDSKDRFEIIQNHCKVFTKNADSDKILIGPNNECICNEPYSNLYDVSKLSCVACKTMFRPDFYTISLARSVHSRGIPLKSLAKNVFLAPPGKNSVDTNAVCERADLFLTDSYSPQLLQQI